MKFPRFSAYFGIVLLALASVGQAQNLTLEVKAAAGQSSAAFENALYLNGPFESPALAFDLTVTEVEGVPVMNPVTWIGFCIELVQGVDTDQTYTYVASPLASILPPDGALRAARLAWVFDNHAPSASSSGWTFSESSPGSLAMQLVVWELALDNDLSLGGPSTTFQIGSQSETLQTNAVALAQSWLDALQSANVDSTYSSSKYLIDGLANPTRQDLLMLRPIPEPGSAALLLVAAAATALSRRRRA